ncbi:MAG: 23S rRNA (pseudouridine(1915)-N(3))-methyltransferase RlmH [Anaerolineae bacterium]|nr:23S rRNA (pseudouridine(1915)-N(3))-methyltransferase RlmH [Gemmatimonadaceae bacterium]
MRIVVVAVGKPRDQALRAAIQDYEARATRYWPIEFLEVREETGRSAPHGVISDREGERLLAKVGGQAHLVACDATGGQMSSAEFAAWLQRERERAVRDIAFVIGGAFGLSSGVREAAATHLSFSQWTMPHEIARLVLVEQLYRAGTIVRGEPYHK